MSDRIEKKSQLWETYYAYLCVVIQSSFNDEIYGYFRVLIIRLGSIFMDFVETVGTWFDIYILFQGRGLKFELLVFVYKPKNSNKWINNYRHAALFWHQNLSQ